MINRYNLFFRDERALNLGRLQSSLSLDFGLQILSWLVELSFKFTHFGQNLAVADFWLSGSDRSSVRENIRS